MSIFDDILDSPLDRVLRAPATAVPSTWRDMETEIDPETERSILAQLGMTALSGASYVGNKLDQITMSRALRGLLGGQPRELLSAFPFSDELGITDPADKVSGKDILQWDDPNAWGDDIAGFALEAGLDPTLPLTFGTGAALSGAGKLAKSAGVLSDATAAAANLARATDAATAPGTMGSRVGLSLRDFLNNAPNSEGVRQKVYETAKRMGTTVDDALLDEKLSGLVGIGVPFRDPSFVLGNGELSQKIASVLDRTGAAAYNAPYSPLPVLRGLFDQDVKGLVDPREQEIAAQASRSLEPQRFEARRRMGGLQQQLDRTGFLRGDEALANRANFYRYLEAVDDGSLLPDDVRGVADEMKSIVEEIRRLRGESGLKNPALDDESIAYAARLKRSFADDPVSSSGGSRVLDLLDPAAQARESFLKNLPEGTAFIDEVAMDPNLSGLLNRAKTPEGLPAYYRNNRLPGDLRDQARGYLTETYGDRLGTLASDPERQGDLRQFLDFAIQLPTRHADKKVPFYADPTEALLARFETAIGTASQGRMTTDLLADQAQFSDALTFAEPTQSLGKALKALPGLDYLGAGRNLEQGLQRRFDKTLGPEGDALRQQFDEVRAAAEAGLDDDAILSAATETARQRKLIGDTDTLDPANLTPELQPLYADARETARLSGVLNRYHTPTRTVETANKTLQRFQQPEAVGALEQFARSATNLTKFGLTSPWPAFQARNLGSGDFNNMVSGAYANPSDWAGSHYEADQLLRGKNPAGIEQRYAHLLGEGLTPEQAGDELRSLFFAGDLASPASSMPFDDAASSSLRVAGETNPVTFWGGFKSNPAFTSRQAASPFGIRGVGTTGDTNILARGANQAGAYVEGQNRVSPFLAFLRQGVDPQEAARRVKDSQVDYSRSTDFERKLGLAFPFYKFTRGQVPFVADQLSSRPSGALAQVVRGQARIQDDNEFVPESVSQTTAIPLPFGQDPGNLRYLTGLGLGYEDPLSLLQPGAGPYDAVQNTLGELAGRLNPLLKAPIEIAAGKQFFSGRDLKDLDSGVGRIISNVGLTEEPPEVPILLDQALANSPVARLLSTIRQATDQRKWDYSLPMNLATGIKITDVPEEKSANVAMRNAIEELLRGNDGVYSTRPNLFVSPEDFLQMDPLKQAYYLKYRDLNAAMRN